MTDARFVTTRWSVVRAAGAASTTEARNALSVLCRTYWYPLYAFVRRSGHDVQEAQDLTQAFFATLLERNDFAAAEPQRGRFRSFLLASMTHFLANDWRRRKAKKRGGGATHLSIDFDLGEERYRREPSHDMTPQRIFERQWAITLLEEALSNLRAEYAARGMEGLFEHLKPQLAGESGQSYQRIAELTGMTEGAVKTAAHRLRRRCRELIKQQIAQTVADPNEIDHEMRQLFAALE